MDCSTPGSPVLHYLPEFPPGFMSFESVMLSNHLIFCYPLSLLHSIFPSIKVFSRVSSSYQVANDWSFSCSISPSNEYSGLICFRIDWFDFLAVQEILKSLFQHNNLKASVLWHSAIFTVQLSYPYMTTRKAVALTI